MESLDRLLLKIERAKKHTLELENAFEGFLKTRPYRFEAEPNSDLKQVAYRLAKADDVPIEFSAILGDALHNLRSSLDHLSFSLVLKGGGSEQQLRHAQFPIYENRADYRSKSAVRMAGMKPDAMKAIDEIEPYVGGAGEYLWHLASLNNVDKHRLLLTVWASIRGHSLLPSDREFIAKQHGGDPANYKNNFAMLDSSLLGRPTKVGEVLFRIPESQAEPDMRVLLAVAFGEPEIVKGNPVTDTLHEMGRHIRRIMFDFDKRGML